MGDANEGTSRLALCSCSSHELQHTNTWAYECSPVAARFIMARLKRSRKLWKRAHSTRLPILAVLEKEEGHRFELECEQYSASLFWWTNTNGAKRRERWRSSSLLMLILFSFEALIIWHGGCGQSAYWPILFAWICFQRDAQLFLPAGCCWRCCLPTNEIQSSGRQPTRVTWPPKWAVKLIWEVAVKNDDDLLSPATRFLLHEQMADRSRPVWVDASDWRRRPPALLLNAAWAQTAPNLWLASCSTFFGDARRRKPAFCSAAPLPFVLKAKLRAPLLSGPLSATSALFINSSDALPVDH